MTMSGPTSFFQVGHRAMSAQLVRMNTAASNLANAGSIAGSEEEAYRPMRTVFEQELDRASGLSSVRVGGVVREDVAALASRYGLLLGEAPPVGRSCPHTREAVATKGH